MFHRICAYPVAVAWVLGAIGVNTATVAFIAPGLSPVEVGSDWQAALFTGLALIPSTMLGYFAGMFFCWPWIRPICSWCNGAPLKAGDQVIILAGPLKGLKTEVREVALGQGRWQVARLDLRSVREKDVSEFFQVYSVVKIRGAESTAVATQV